MYNPQYKYKITHLESKETKLFIKYNEMKDFCPIPRSTLYKILDGKKSKWCKEYKVEAVRLPSITRIVY